MRAAPARVLLTAAIWWLAGCSSGSQSPAEAPDQANTATPEIAAFSPPAPNSRPLGAKAFVDVTVLPMTSAHTALAGQTVLVRDGRIADIGPVGQIDVPADAERIEGTGRFLMPGLADMHVHTTNVNDLFLYVANGITTVRMMWGEDQSLARRSEIDMGEVLAPRYFTAGPGIDGSPPYWPETVVVDAENEARQAVAEQHLAGYDFIKVYNQLNRTAYDAIVDEAFQRGIPVIGHVPAAIDIEHALQSAHLGTEHLIGYARLVTADGGNNWGSTIDDARLAAAVVSIRESGTWTSPTLTVLTRTQNDVARVTGSAGWRYISDVLRDWLTGSLTQPPSSRDPAAEANRKRMVRELHAGDARLLLGTDTGVSYLIPGYSLHEELAHWVDAGLTPAEVLRVATADAAEFVGLGGVTGTIAAGAEADLLLLDADPRIDIGNVQLRAGVMLRGHWYTEAELQAWLEDIAVSYGR